MKIIISHDVDHLYVSDHIFRDLILEKIWIRGCIQLLQGKISRKTFFYRLGIIFRNRMNRIDEIIEFDRKYGIPSVFFFGMAKGLGMSYSIKKAKKMIEYVKNKGFDVGVHGVEFENYYLIKKEYETFKDISGLDQFGIRNHYVRFNNDTFSKMAKAGYVFDSTWFDKDNNSINAPYKIDGMWEFPLHIMDSYICKPGFFEKGLKDTFLTIKEAEKKGVPYCTILFHDFLFDENYNPEMRNWYIKTVEFCVKNRYHFISYRDAIGEMEENGKQNRIL